MSNTFGRPGRKQTDVAWAKGMRPWKNPIKERSYRKNNPPKVLDM